MHKAIDTREPHATADAFEALDRAYNEEFGDKLDSLEAFPTNRRRSVSDREVFQQCYEDLAKFAQSGGLENWINNDSHNLQE